MTLIFNTDHHPKYRKAEQVSPLIKRITARNKSSFTFTGTGTYIVGQNSVAVIDPGPYKRLHVNAIWKEVKNKEVSHILITHTHPDHSPATKLLMKRLKKATQKAGKELATIVCGFGPHPALPESKKESRGNENENRGNKKEQKKNQEESGDLDFMPDKFLTDGEVIQGNGWTIEAIHTPGHISNHLCFALKEESAIFTGDHIMGWSTSIIPPPDGSLLDYFNSCKKLLERKEIKAGNENVIYYPTHGAPISNPKTFTQELVKHREMRNEQIIDCLKSGQMTIEEMVAIIYVEHPKRLHKAAARSVLAHMIYLFNKGLVEVVGDNQKSQQNQTPETDNIFKLK